MSPRGSARRAVHTLFFFSGVAGLIYEVVWTRFLVLFLGNTAHANAVVLATFMGGLGLGYRRYGRLADRLASGPDAERDLLSLYARLEGAIGAYGLLFPSLIAVVGAAYGWIGRGLGADSRLLLPLSLASASLLLLGPAVLMGGTLPVLVTWVNRRGEEAGRVVSLLYATNSAGAVLGGVLSGFVLVERLGQRHTVWVAAGLNLTLAGIGWWLSARARRTTVSGPPADVSDDAAVPIVVDHAPVAALQQSMRRRWVPALAAGVSGFAALVLELVWIRLFAIVFGSATQTFTVVVCAFITGIAAGSALARKRLRGADSVSALRQLVVAAIAAAAFLVVAERTYSYLPYVLASLRIHYGELHAFYRFQAAKFLLCLPIMIVPTLLAGLILPLCTQLAEGHGAGRTTGRIFGSNALGSVLGAALGGTVLIPRLGLRGTVLVAELAYVAIATVAISRVDVRTRRFAYVSFLLLGPAMALGLRWDVRALDAGEFRRNSPVGRYADWAFDQSRAELTFHEDGAASTVDVLSLPDGKRFLKVNGKTDASNWGDVLTAAGTPAVGALAAEHLRNALVVGFGSGATAAALLKFGLDVSVLEIEPAVLKAAPLFTDVNDGCLDRVHVHLGDARTWLALSKNRYDVIVNEPSNPWVAGVGSLFTREFFQSVDAHLAKGGSFVQWFHLYDMDDASVQMILRTLSSVFPYVSVWHFENDIALLARQSPINSIGDATGDATSEKAVLDRMAQRFGQAPVRTYFNRLGVYDLASLLSLQLASEEGTRRLLSDDDGPLHVDDLPLLEYRAPRAQFDRSYSFWLKNHDERRGIAQGDAGSDLVLAELLRTRRLTDNEMIDFTLLQSSEPWAPEAFRFMYLGQVLKACREPWTLARLVLNLEKGRRYGESERVLAALELFDAASARTTYLRATVRLRRLGPVAAAKDALMRSLLANCGHAKADDPYTTNCRTLAQSLSIAIEN